MCPESTCAPLRRPARSTRASKRDGRWTGCPVPGTLSRCWVGEGEIRATSGRNVMARQRGAMVGVLLGLLVLVVAGRADEASAVKTIEKLGGLVTRDDKIAGEPVVGVDLSFARVT